MALLCSTETCGKLCTQRRALRGPTLETATGHLSEEALVLRATGTHPAPYPQGCGAHTLTFDLPEKGPEIRM